VNIRDLSGDRTLIRFGTGDEVTTCQCRNRRPTLLADLGARLTNPVAWPRSDRDELARGSCVRRCAIPEQPGTFQSKPAHKIPIKGVWAGSAPSPAMTDLRTIPTPNIALITPRPATNRPPADTRFTPVPPPQPSANHRQTWQSGICVRNLRRAAPRAISSSSRSTPY